MTHNAVLLANRKNLLQFLREAPATVDGYPILAVGEWTPGDEAQYALAQVITREEAWVRDGDHAFNLHTLLWVDDSKEGWRLIRGIYRLRFDTVVRMANLEFGLRQQHTARVAAEKATREAFKVGGGAYRVYTRTDSGRE